MKILLYPVAVFLFWLFVWFVGDGNPVPSSHALAFLIHTSGVWFLPCFVGAIIAVILTTLGTLKTWFAVVTRTWLWIFSIILIFSVAGSFALTRYNAGGDNVNVTARYHAYAAERNWDK